MSHVNAVYKLLVVPDCTLFCLEMVYIMKQALYQRKCVKSPSLLHQDLASSMPQLSGEHTHDETLLEHVDDFELGIQLLYCNNIVTVCGSRTSLSLIY